MGLSIPSGQSLQVAVPWIPGLGIDLAFLIDRLSLFFGLVVTLVCA